MQKNVHSVAHTQWNSSTITPIECGLTWKDVNHIATPVIAPSTKLTRTRASK